MRFQINQNLFAVHFGISADNPKTFGFFFLPMMYDDVEPDIINFAKLTVTEHHKVPSCHDPKSEPTYDGYLLKDESGMAFSNQYPTASYGQVSDESNRRFHARLDGTKTLTEFYDENPNTVFEYHLLSDVLEKIQRGIKELALTPKSNEFYQRCMEKSEKLAKLYDRIVKAFHEKYPDYQLDMAWKPLMETDLLWPDVSIYKRLSPEKAQAVTKEELINDVNSDGRVEVEYADGNRLVIEKAEGRYALGQGDAVKVKTLNVYFGEKTEEDGKTVFYVHQTEYFPQAWVELAVECFMKRYQTGDYKAIGMGMSIEAVAAKDKELEGIVQVLD